MVDPPFHIGIIAYFAVRQDHFRERVASPVGKTDRAGRPGNTVHKIDMLGCYITEMFGPDGKVFVFFCVDVIMQHFEDVGLVCHYPGVRDWKFPAQIPVSGWFTVPQLVVKYGIGPEPDGPVGHFQQFLLPFGVAGVSHYKTPCIVMAGECVHCFIIRYIRSLCSSGIKPVSRSHSCNNHFRYRSVCR